MTADALLAALYGAGVAALSLVTIVLGVMARYAPDVIRTFLEGRKLLSLERASALATRAVEEHARANPLRGEDKAQAAQGIVRALAPIAANGADETQIADIVSANVAKLRAAELVPQPPRTVWQEGGTS